MGEVDEENETEEYEDGCTDQGDVVAPEHKEAVWNEEADGDKDDPEQDLGTPPSATM